MSPAYPLSAKLKLPIIAFLRPKLTRVGRLSGPPARRSQFVERVRIGIVLDHEGVDVLQFGDAMRRSRGQFFVGDDDEALPARRQQRTSESGVGQFISADAGRGGNPMSEPDRGRCSSS